VNPLDIYKALADESRLRLLNVVSRGDFNVQELTAILSIGQSTISHHLRTLERAGIVRCRKQGTWAYYGLPAAMVAGVEDAESSSPAVTANSTKPTLAESIVRNLLQAKAQGLIEPRVFEEDGPRIQEVLDRRRADSHQFFESVAGSWKNLRREMEGSEGFLSDIVKNIDPELILLELGCGAGALLERVLPRPGQTIAVDYSQAMLDEARRALGQKGEHVDLRLGYLEHLPLGDQSVDIAVAYMVLHHVATPVAALEGVFRVLKPGGRVFIVDLTQHDNENFREQYAHLWLGFDPLELTGALEGVGFTDCETKFLGEANEAFLLKGNKQQKGKKR
jgi:ArsR family transcriptional regulator